MKKIIPVQMEVGDLVSAERVDIGQLDCDCETCVQARQWLNERCFLAQIEGKVIQVYCGCVEVDEVDGHFAIRRIISEPLCIIEDHEYGLVEVPLTIYRWSLLGRKPT